MGPCTRPKVWLDLAGLTRHVIIFLDTIRIYPSQTDSGHQSTVLSYFQSEHCIDRCAVGIVQGGHCSTHGVYHRDLDSMYMHMCGSWKPVLWEHMCYYYHSKVMHLTKSSRMGEKAWYVGTWQYALRECALRRWLERGSAEDASMWAPGNDLTDATARRMAFAPENGAVCKIRPVALHVGLVADGVMLNVL
jgi:hypothetical protein